MTEKPEQTGIEERLSRIEEAMISMSSDISMLARDVGQAFGILGLAYDRLEKSYNEILQNILFSQAVYLGNNRALTYLKSGHKMFVDTKSVDIGTHLMFGGEWETHYTNAFLKLIKPGDHVLDIGANHGFYSLIAATKVTSSGHIYAFEARAEFFELIKASVSVNGLNNTITIEHLGVSDHKYETTMLFDTHWSGGGYLATDSVDNNEAAIARGFHTEKVSCIPLDDYFPDPLQVIDAIKMDIEGSEGLALMGMSKLVDRSPNLKIMMEFCPSMLSRFSVDAPKIIDFFKARAFKCWTICSDGSLMPATWDMLLNDHNAVQNVILSRQDLS